jgi:hypothetical protein
MLLCNIFLRFGPSILHWRLNFQRRTCDNSQKSNWKTGKSLFLTANFAAFADFKVFDSCLALPVSETQSGDGIVDVEPSICSCAAWVTSTVLEEYLSVATDAVGARLPGEPVRMLLPIFERGGEYVDANVEKI